MNISSLQEVGVYNFKQEVELAEKPVVIFVHRDGEVCKNFRIVVEQAALTHIKHFKFCSLDSRKNPHLANELTDNAYPATAIYCDGSFITSLASRPDVQQYREFLNRQLVIINRKRYRQQSSTNNQS